MFETHTGKSFEDNLQLHQHSLGCQAHNCSDTIIKKIGYIRI